MIPVQAEGSTFSPIGWISMWDKLMSLIFGLIDPMIWWEAYRDGLIRVLKLWVTFRPSQHSSLLREILPRMPLHPPPSPLDLAGKGHYIPYLPSPQFDWSRRFSVLVFALTFVFHSHILVHWGQCMSEVWRWFSLHHLYVVYYFLSDCPVL